MCKALWYLVTESETAEMKTLKFREHHSQRTHDLANVWFLSLGSRSHQYPLEWPGKNRLITYHIMFLLHYDYVP